MSNIYNLSLIRDLCVKKNISQRELARRVGMTISGIQRIIKMNSTTPQTIMKIADALDVDPGVFITKSDTERYDIVGESDEMYNYREKYIRLLEDYNKLLREKLEKKECDKNRQTNNPERSRE